MRDPWKGLRGVMAMTLLLEAIVVALALPVVAKLGGGLSTGAGWFVGSLALAMVAAAFLQRRRWGLGLALALQVVMIATVFVVPVLGALGVVFALVWAYILWLRRDLARRLEQYRQAGSGEQRPA
jgi:ABC-type Co2+ transport system permease subunit